MENQINSLLAGQLDTFDNAELEKELAELMGESTPIAAKKEAAAPPQRDLVLPDVPTHEIRLPAPAVSAKEETTNEERELIEA